MRKSHERRARLYWCDNCNIPLIAQQCSLCKGRGREILLYHGMEIRPGFEYTVQRINEILAENYGVENALGTRTVLLHKVAGLDRTEEIIVDGEVFGTLAYNPEQRRFQIRLRGYGAALLARKGAKKNLVFCDERVLRRHLKNGWIYAGEIREFVEVSGDADVLLLIGNYTGVGVAKFRSGEQMPEKSIRVKDIGRWEVREKTTTLEEIVRGNEETLRMLEQKATQDILEAIQKFPGYQIGVSFSGGKDSAVAMDLLSKCCADFFVLFVDTGLEFPETLEYVKKAAAGKKLFVLHPDTSFWDLIWKMGPPAKDYRWCCKVCKLAPVAKFVAEHQRKILCVEGRRKAESFAREKIELVEQNPFVPGQVLVNPVRDWSSFHVWLYILWKNIEVNPLYFRDFERIGCYLCPAEQACEFEEVGRLHPEMHGRLMEFLRAWAESQGLGREFWEEGLWRWKKPPKKVKGVGGVTTEVFVRETLTCDGEIFLEGNFPFAESVEDVENALGILGETQKRYDAVIVKTQNSRLLFFPNSDFSVVAREKEKAKKMLVQMLQQLLRLRFCTSCQICVQRCPAKAVEIKNGKPVNNLRKCRKCLKCIESCVVARYYDKWVRIVMEG
ncbi:MAG: phosphoadenosine phosphosulfate reductase family protein [Thermoplasmata archaeon]